MCAQFGGRLKPYCMVSWKHIKSSFTCGFDMENISTFTLLRKYFHEENLFLEFFNFKKSIYDSH